MGAQKLPSLWSVRATRRRNRALRRAQVPYEELYVSSFNVKARLPEVRNVLSKCGITPEQSAAHPLVFFAGYNARIAGWFRKMGFRVFFSDSYAPWARRAKKKGLPSFVEDSLHSATNPEQVLAYASYQPYYMASISVKREFEETFQRLLNSKKGILIFDFFKPRTQSLFLAQSVLSDFAAQNKVSMGIYPIRGSQTPEGGRLCVIHLHRKK